MRLTIFALSISLLASVAAHGAGESGYIRFNRLVEIDGPVAAEATAAPGEANMNRAVIVEGGFTPPNCDCKLGRTGVLSPFLEFVKASKSTKRRRPARALTCGTFEGEASWYTAREGAPMASGQGFDPSKHWAAHKTLPFGTVVTVHCPSGRKVDVTIKDDGPHIDGRIIDLTRASADRCGITSRGHARVTIEVKCPASLAREAAPLPEAAPQPTRPTLDRESAPGVRGVPAELEFEEFPVS